MGTYKLGWNPLICIASFLALNPIGGMAPSRAQANETACTLDTPVGLERELTAVAREVRRDACRHYEKYKKDVALPATLTESFDCRAFGVEPGIPLTTFDQALTTDCDVLMYRPTPAGTDLSNDPIGDLALQCRTTYDSQLVRSKGLPILNGGPARAEAYRDQRRHRAEVAKHCAIQLFGAIYEKGGNERITTSEEEPNWGDRDADLARIEGADIHEPRRQEILERVSEGDLSLQGRQRPIDTRGFAAMLDQVIADEARENGIHPSLGSGARWSDDFLNCFPLPKMAWARSMGKQLLVLSYGIGDQFTPAGQEMALREWIMAQPDYSIEPEAMFRKAYRLANGDVTQTLRTIENVLSRHWDTPRRHELSQTQKLKPITNTLGEKEDVFGSWYHLFGTMLYGVSAKNRSMPMTAAVAEAAGSLFLTGFKPEVQENGINISGARIGNSLRRSVKRGSWSDSELSDSEALDFESYTNVDESFDWALERRRLQDQPVEAGGATLE